MVSSAGTEVRQEGLAQEGPQAERDQCTPSEMVEIGTVLEELERERAKERRGGDHKGNPGNFPELGQTRDKVAAALGVSGRHYEKAKRGQPVRLADFGLLSEGYTPLDSRFCPH